jgi:hypothetical protein
MAEHSIGDHTERSTMFLVQIFGRGLQQMFVDQNLTHWYCPNIPPATLESLFNSTPNVHL